MQQLKIIFAGSGAFGVPTLRQLAAEGHDIVQVFTQPSRPAGRGRKLTPTPIARLATEMSLPVNETADINAESLEVADVMVVIAFGQKIAPHVVNHARMQAVNLHASRLPKYRGAAPINWAMIDGEPTTGNSIIRLAERMDAGAMLAMSELEIGESETARELHDRLADDGAGLMSQTLQALADGRAVETEQDHAQATLASKLSRNLAWIDFEQSALQVARRINGMSPWPGIHVRMGVTSGPKLLLVRARPVDAKTSAQPGSIAGDDMVACADGAIQLLEIQSENGRRMSPADYARGHAWTPGMPMLSEQPVTA